MSPCPSTPGEGSVFRVRMLLTADHSRAPLPRIDARVTGYLGARRKIMVVDDDADHRMLMRDTLGPLGFTLFSASDGVPMGSCRACRMAVAGFFRGATSGSVRISACSGSCSRSVSSPNSSSKLFTGES